MYGEGCHLRTLKISALGHYRFGTSSFTWENYCLKTSWPKTTDRIGINNTLATVSTFLIAKDLGIGQRSFKMSADGSPGNDRDDNHVRHLYASSIQQVPPSANILKLLRSVPRSFAIKTKKVYK